MKFSKCTIKAVTPVMALFQKQHRLLFKQGYDNLRSTRGESAASADTARSGRCFHRNQSAVCASLNVSSDTETPPANCETPNTSKIGSWQAAASYKLFDCSFFICFCQLDYLIVTIVFKNYLTIYLSIHFTF